ncbi:MAG: FecR domain-containing protein [Sandaracinaceae bacterium]
MSPVPPPTGDVLEDVLDEAAIASTWREIQTRRHRRRTGPRKLAVAAAGAAAAVGTALAATHALWPGEDPSSPVAAAGQIAQPLRTADGQALHALRSDERGLVVPLDDGSRLRLHPRSTLDVLANDGQGIRLRLGQGAVRFEVRPGGPRRWVVEAGPARVEVVGTVFRVTRDGDEVAIAVDRGRLRVRADGLDGGEVQLGAGGRLSLPLRDGEPRGATPEHDPPPAPDGDGAARTDPPAATGARPRARSTPPGPVSAAPDIDGWLAAANRARAAGDSVDAARWLSQVVDEAAPEDSRRALAAYLLGRLQVRRLHRPQAGLRHLGLAVGRLPPPLRQDVLACQIEAHVALGQRARASAILAALEGQDPARAERLRERLGLARGTTTAP